MNEQENMVFSITQRIIFGDGSEIKVVVFGNPDGSDAATQAYYAEIYEILEKLEKIVLDGE